MKRIHDDVAKFGWHVVAVNRNDRDAQEFAFTVGLFQTYEHPELLVSGLPQKVAHGVLSTCVERIEEGSTLNDGELRTDLLNGFSAAVVKVDPSRYSEFLGSAIGFYDSHDFPALQVVWPDRGNHFPWEPEYDSSYVGSQEILAITVG